MATWLIEAIQARLDEKTMWPMRCLSFFDLLIAGQSAPSWLPQQGHITAGRRQNAVADWAKAWAQSVAAPSAVELDAAKLGCNTGVLLDVDGTQTAPNSPGGLDAQPARLAAPVGWPCRARTSLTYLGQQGYCRRKARQVPRSSSGSDGEERS